MSKEEALIQLLTIEKRLPYGSKARIAQALGHKNRNNVQAAFRGLLGKDLTIMVLQEAKKLAGHGKKSAKMSPAHLQIKKRKKVAATVFGLGEVAEPKSQIGKLNLIIKNKC